MPVETDADRAIFVSAEDFGAAATWTKAGGGSWSLDVVFDAAYRLAQFPGVEDEIEGASPRFRCRSADLPSGAAHGDAVTIGASSFRVVEIMPDCTGMIDVRLHEV